MTDVTSVTVFVPLTIRRRGGRKMIISPDGVAMTAIFAPVLPTRLAPRKQRDPPKRFACKPPTPLCREG